MCAAVIPNLQEQMPPCIVVLSGGLDSCVVAAQAVALFGKEKVFALHYQYGQKTERREFHAFQDICKDLGISISHRLVASNHALGRIGGSALTDDTIEVPAYPLIASPGAGIPTSVPVTYVPFRNAHMLCLAVSWAEVIGANRIYVGSVESDTSPDAKPAFIEAFNKVIALGTKPGVSINVQGPVMDMSKEMVVKMGLQYKAPMHLSWSCYQSETVPCGTCKPCVQRQEAFIKAGVTE
jgi:7-cyano-7-deazaguanine synthase